MQSIYRPILKQALSITWQFKHFWFFGLFAALLGNGGVFNLIFNNIQIVENQGVFLLGFKDFIRTFSFSKLSSSLSSLFLAFDFWVVLFFVVILMAIVFFIWISIVSQAAIVFCIKRALKNSNGLFTEAFHMGTHKFWSVFLLNILMKVILFVATLIISLPFIIVFLKGVESAALQTGHVILTFLVLVPFAAVLSFLVKYATIFVVNENEHVGLAIKNAWQLFIKNWIVSIEMALLLFLVNILSSILLVVVIIFVSLPFVMLGMIASYIASNTFFWLVVTLGILTFITILFFFGALLNVWQTANWVILFEKILHSDVYSKILRFGAALTSGKKLETGK